MVARMQHSPANTHDKDAGHDPWLGSGRYWLCQFAGWGGVGGIVLLVLSLGSRREIADRINATLAQSAQSGVAPDRIGDAHFTVLVCLAGLIASHGWRMVIVSQGWMRWPTPRLVRHAVSWWLGLTLVLSVISIRFFIPNVPAESPTESLVPCVMMNSTLLGAWISLYVLAHYYQALHQANLDRMELAAAVTASQLLALQGQTNPHFLFNSLNTIRALMPADATEARCAITLLADTLRATLVDGKKAWIPLSRELEIVHAYLALERLRFDDDLRVEEEIAPAALNARIPSLMLQTLVENAIKHGLLQNGGRGILKLCAEADANSLLLRVCSPGTLGSGGAEAVEASLGTGLANVRERLRLLYGPGARLSLSSPAPGQIEALVFIPNALSSAPP